MPIPLDELNRALVPRVLTPATTVAELLYLLAEQPEPRRCYAVVRVAADLYDMLALDDLREPLEPDGESALSLALGALPGLLRAAAPVRQDTIGLAAAERAQAATPRRRPVVLNADGAVLGVMASVLLGTSKARSKDAQSPTRYSIRQSHPQPVRGWPGRASRCHHRSRIYTDAFPMPASRDPSATRLARLLQPSTPARPSHPSCPAHALRPPDGRAAER